MGKNIKKIRRIDLYKNLKLYFQKASNDQNAGAPDEDDTLDEPPRLPQGGNRRRLGVSAEVPDENEALNYNRVIIPKDADTQKALMQTMGKNLLFAHLDPEEQKAIFDAMFPVEKVQNETIIEQVIF